MRSYTCGLTHKISILSKLFRICLINKELKTNFHVLTLNSDFFDSSIQIYPLINGIVCITNFFQCFFHQEVDAVFVMTNVIVTRKQIQDVCPEVSAVYAHII